MVTACSTVLSFVSNVDSFAFSSSKHISTISKYYNSPLLHYLLLLSLETYTEDTMSNAGFNIAYV